MVRPSGKGVQTNIKNIIDWMEGKREFFSSFEICDILEEKKFSAHFQKFPDQSAYNWLARLTTRSPPSHCPSPSTLHLALLRQLARISSSVYWLCPVNSIPPSLIKQVVQPRNLVERDKWSGITISDSLRKSLLFHANSLLFAISSDRKFLNTRSTYFYIIFLFSTRSIHHNWKYGCLVIILSRCAFLILHLDNVSSFDLFSFLNYRWRLIRNKITRISKIVEIKSYENRY